ncbi:MAG TPA: hypothetical protein VFO01_11160 [Trebonia sp.]|nr:hypothetical protein [Trebonia sp.]
MTQHNWDDDQRLFEDLSGAFRETASLSGVIAEYGKGAYAWRTVERDLLRASLSFDSSLERVTERRSGPDDPRVLTFTAAPLSLELEVMPGQIAGQIVPPGAGEIRVETADGVTYHVEADDVGFFILPNVPRGTVRLRCDTAVARLVTDWICL